MGRGTVPLPLVTEPDFFVPLRVPVVNSSKRCRDWGEVEANCVPRPLTMMRVFCFRRKKLRPTHLSTCAVGQHTDSKREPGPRWRFGLVCSTWRTVISQAKVPVILCE